ncbi:uncharacterized protein E0L32_008262 [Thyridium curvatum]|uniref:Nucleoside transporter n=1 Tax=Thyridium curvatum TaxID=1093900 RepID=A0A507AT07_9PEZI|nr:uncharacterized protein E0L32_008262 [Thyridium curvatum]TPX10873.1 hypothetical protein E0L32_008262 [Thyridium curvatum]
MDRIRKMFAERPEPQEYAPLAPAARDAESESFLEGEVEEGNEEDCPFSWVEYSIFALIGVAMLWAWNMFLAAAPYFQKRFESNEWIAQRFQSAIITIFSLNSLAAMFILATRQSSASYPFRINASLLFNAGVFTLLALSTVWFLDVSTGGYLAFLLIMSAASSWGTSLLQNGALAFAASFGRPEYTQAIMAGQGIAGVLPATAQIVSVLAVPPSGPSESTRDDIAPPPQEAGRAAFMYFLTAVVVCIAAFLSFIPLVRRHNRLIERRLEETMAQSRASVEEAERAARKVVGLGTLARKLRWVGGSVFVCFTVTMFFPVFTAKILSVRPAPEQGRLFQPAAFIPLGFFFWNLGDLAGRVATLLPISRLVRRRPRLMLALAAARLAWLPLYALCNVGGRGAAVASDAFYLLAVQLTFGLTNGWLGSSGMMAAADWVEEGEREAAGGFMGLCLVAGLGAGSVLSFSAAGL